LRQCGRGRKHRQSRRGKQFELLHDGIPLMVSPNLMSGAGFRMYGL
jgi:hypothetical protein